MLMRFVGEDYYGKDVIKIIKKGIAKGGKHMSLSDKGKLRLSPFFISDKSDKGTFSLSPFFI